MHRTSLTAVAAAAVATASLSVPAANAATVTQLILDNFQDGQSRWQLEDDSVERLGVDANNNGLLDVGDTLRGIVAFQQFVALPSGTVTLLDGVNNSTVHGLFEIEVTEKTQVAPNAFNFQFGPHSGFEDEIGVSGAMVAIWENPAPAPRLDPYDASPGAACATVAGCEDAATQGDRILVAGFDPAKENIWGAGPLPDDIEAARGVAPSANVGTYGFRINVLEDDLDLPLPFVDVEGGSIIAGEFYDFPAEVVGSGQILGTAGTNSPFPAFDDADLQFAVIPVPAALPLFLAGLGALGMIGWRRNAA